MSAEIITSVQNPHVRAMRALRDAKARKKAGLILVEGEKMLTEARSSGLRIGDVLYDPERIDPVAAGEGAQPVAPHIIDSICDTMTPQGLVAAVEPPKWPLLSDIIARREHGALLIAALDGIQDPGNVGTIWRTCDAAAFDALILSGVCPDPFSPKVLRSSMGAAFRIPALRGDLSESLNLLKETGCAIVSSQLDGEPFFGGLPDGDVVLIIGNEARGVSPDIQRMATHRLRLPMPGRAESLNAAVAAGIMMYACLDGRRG